MKIDKDTVKLLKQHAAENMNKIALEFLADHTIGRAFVTACRLSVCLSSVTFCIQAKRLHRFA